MIYLSVDSPRFVHRVVRAAVDRWRWRRIEDKMPAFHSSGAGRRAAWRPVLCVLGRRDSTNWGPEHQGVLFFLTIGKQWTQQRLHRAGLADSNLCQLRFDLLGGGQVGRLLHGCFCSALRSFRGAHRPGWIKSHLNVQGHDLSNAALLAFTRGLVSAPILVDPQDGFDTFWWQRQWHRWLSVPSGCIVF